MKTSLDELKVIDAYIHNKLHLGSSLLLARREATNKSFAERVHYQRMVHFVINEYHRYTMKKALDQFHKSLMKNNSKGSLSMRIDQLFQSNQS